MAILKNSYKKYCHLRMKLSDTTVIRGIDAGILREIMIFPVFGDNSF
jgi:hypothetical protein